MGSLADKAGKVKASKAAIKSAIEAQGVAVGGAPLGEYAGKIHAISGTYGAVEEVAVTTTGSVYKGDPVELVQELVAGEGLSFVLGGAKLLDAKTLANARQDIAVNAPVVAIFTQNGKTCLKAMRFSGGEWNFGPTVYLLDTAVDWAVLVPYQTDWQHKNGTYYLAVLYGESECGMVKFYAFDALIPTPYGTDIWTDSAPRNVCATWSPRMVNYTAKYFRYETMLTVCAQNPAGEAVITGITPTWMWSESERRNFLTAEIYATKTLTPGKWPGPVMEGGAFEDFELAACSDEVYASRAWAMSSSMGDGAVVVTYPGEDGKRHLVKLLLVRESNGVAHDYTPAGCHQTMLEGSLPSAALLSDIQTSVYPIMQCAMLAHGLSRISGPNQKAALGVEQWLDGSSMRFWPVLFGEESKKYASSIGVISAARIGAKKDCAVVGCCEEHTYRGIVMAAHGDTMSGGPGVVLAENVGNAALAESGSGAVLVWQHGGNISLRQLEARTVAVSGTGVCTDGMAMSGGRPGQTIKIRRLVSA